MQAPSFRRRLMIRLLLQPAGRSIEAGIESERLLITDTDGRRHWP